MKVALYSPYIPKHFGGGEKHLFQTAAAIAENHECCVAMSAEKDTDKIRHDYQSFFEIDLSKVKFIETPLGTNKDFLTKLLWTKQFDYLYSFCDGSLFFSLAKKNNLHLQIPFTHPQSGLINRLKLKNWQIKNTNSKFTKQVIENAWQTQVQYVHYPLVDQLQFTPAKNRKKIILNVGRFFKQLHNKRQDVLIEAFKQFIDQLGDRANDWRLVLVGAVEDSKYFAELEKLADGYNVEFLTSCKHKQLIDLYQTAQFYWHATGFDVDEQAHPEMTEHFGISTVEAMAGGAIPLVVWKGGQKEILGEKFSQLGWQTIDQLVGKTIELMTSQQSEQLTQELRARSGDFGREHFEATLNEMLKN